MLPLCCGFWWQDGCKGGMRSAQLPYPLKPRKRVKGHHTSTCSKTPIHISQYWHRNRLSCDEIVVEDSQDTFYVS
jgi:hypothetical protein